MGNITAYIVCCIFFTSHVCCSTQPEPALKSYDGVATKNSTFLTDTTAPQLWKRYYQIIVTATVSHIFEFYLTGHSDGSVLYNNIDSSIQAACTNPNIGSNAFQYAYATYENSQIRQVLFFSFRVLLYSDHEYLDFILYGGDPYSGAYNIKGSVVSGCGYKTDTIKPYSVKILRNENA